MKKVTIMIPTYNQAQFIEQCIDSALAQDYSNLEVIISDDSTNNKTEKIVKSKYLSDPRVKYFQNIPTLGRVGNYHKTLYERATGDYVLNLDGDDWLIDDGYISQAVKIMDKHDDVSCVIADEKKYIENEGIYLGNDKSTNSVHIFEGNEYLCNIMKDNNITFSHLSTLFRKDMAMKVGFYTKDILYSDGDSIFRLANQSRVAFIDKAVGVWRRHSRNETFGISKIDNFDSLFEHFNHLQSNMANENNKILNNCNWFYKMKKHYLKIYLFEIKESYGYRKLFSVLVALFVYDKKLFISMFRWLFIIFLSKFIKVR